MAKTSIPRKSVPGAGSEPIEQPVIHDHRVTFQKAGWFTFAYCPCGWINCDYEVSILSMKAAAHGIGK